MRQLPNLVEQVKQINLDLQEIKQRQFVGASTVPIKKVQTADAFDFDDSINNNWEVSGWVDYVANTMDYPFARMVCKVWVGGVLHKLGDGDIIGFRAAPIDFRMYRLIGGGVEEKKGLRFYFRVKNISGSGKAIKLKFYVMATDEGVIYPLAIKRVSNY